MRRSLTPCWPRWTSPAPTSSKPRSAGACSGPRAPSGIRACPTPALGFHPPPLSQFLELLGRVPACSTARFVRVGTLPDLRLDALRLRVLLGGPYHEGGQNACRAFRRNFRGGQQSLLTERPQAKRTTATISVTDYTLSREFGRAPWWLFSSSGSGSQAAVKLSTSHRSRSGPAPDHTRNSGPARAMTGAGNLTLAPVRRIT